jgi:CRISPR/Cas system endoribonuclease Cas6 (RAMP superfamily)
MDVENNLTQCNANKINAEFTEVPYPQNMFHSLSSHIYKYMAGNFEMVETFTMGGRCPSFVALALTSGS